MHVWKISIGTLISALLFLSSCAYLQPVKEVNAKQR